MTIDTATNALMQSIENPTLTLFSKTIAHAFDPIVLTILAIIIAAFVYMKFSKKKGIFLATTIVITVFLIKFSKEIFQRARPINTLIPETSFSFPSGHAIMVIIFFGLIAYLFASKKYKITTIAITTLIVLITGFTRIYLRVHWLTDVIAGFTLGIIILIIAIIVYKK